MVYRRIAASSRLMSRPLNHRSAFPIFNAGSRSKLYNLERERDTNKKHSAVRPRFHPFPGTRVSKRPSREVSSVEKSARGDSRFENYGKYLPVTFSVSKREGFRRYSARGTRNTRESTFPAISSDLICTEKCAYPS